DGEGGERGEPLHGSAGEQRDGSGRRRGARKVPGAVTERFRSSPPTGTPAARIGPARLTCLTILRPHHMLLRLRRTPVLCALAALLAAPALAQPAPPQHLIFPDLEGEALVAALRAAYTPPATLGYDAARDVIFQWEQDRNGGLRCVYTGYTIALTPGADPSADAYAQGINTEHTWPRSRGAAAEPARS